MPTITWTLNKTCNNCQAEVTLTSELGEDFKLSESKHQRELYKQAQQWCSLYPKGNTRSYPSELSPYIMYGFSLERGMHHYPLPEPMFYYIKCPLCNERIYIC